MGSLFAQRPWRLFYLLLCCTDSLGSELGRLYRASGYVSRRILVSKVHALSTHSYVIVDRRRHANWFETTYLCTSLRDKLTVPLTEDGKSLAHLAGHQLGLKYV